MDKENRKELSSINSFLDHIGEEVSNGECKDLHKSASIHKYNMIQPSPSSITVASGNLTLSEDYCCFSSPEQISEISKSRERQNFILSGQKEFDIRLQSDHSQLPIQENGVDANRSNPYNIQEIEDSNLQGEYNVLSPPIHSFAIDGSTVSDFLVCTELNSDSLIENNTTNRPLSDSTSEIAYTPTDDGNAASDFSPKKEKTWYLDPGEPTDLINVQKFLDSFSIELRNQEESIQKELQLSERLTKKQNKEIKDRCSVNEYLKLSSQFFVDPTIFCLLRQYHSGSSSSTGSPTLSLPSLPMQPDSTGIARKSKGKNKESLSSTQNQTKIIPQKRNIDYLKSGNNKGHRSILAHPIPFNNATDIFSNNLPTKSNSLGFGHRDSKPRLNSSNKSSLSDHITEYGTSIRPEPSALELRFWEMAKELDNSPLASLKEENRIKVPKIRTEMNYIASKSYKGLPKSQSAVNKHEVILSVAFYNQNKPATRMQEFLVLGSQPLTALRDAFYCLRDFYKVTPWEQPTQNAITNLTDKKTSSSYFFVENVFYNDLRDPRAIDYS
ncbi:4560_t:CDS:2, partial [Acaulospora colombiana]